MPLGYKFWEREKKKIRSWKVNTISQQCQERCHVVPHGLLNLSPWKSGISGQPMRKDLPCTVRISLCIHFYVKTISGWEKKKTRIWLPWLMLGWEGLSVLEHLSWFLWPSEIYFLLFPSPNILPYIPDISLLQVFQIMNAIFTRLNSQK